MSVRSLLICIGLWLPVSLFAATPTWTDICPDKTVDYCGNINKQATNGPGSPPLLRGTKLGKIKGVAWRPKGSIIGMSPAVPSAGIRESVRTAPRDAFYYIIDDGSGNYFLRQAREIAPK